MYKVGPLLGTFESCIMDYDRVYFFTIFTMSCITLKYFDIMHYDVLATFFKGCNFLTNQSDTPFLQYLFEKCSAIILGVTKDTSKHDQIEYSIELKAVLWNLRCISLRGITYRFLWVNEIGLVQFRVCSPYSRYLEHYSVNSSKLTGWG